MEGKGIAKTPGGGYLEPGAAYDFAYLKIDIVKNSQIVRKYSRSIVAQTYDDLKRLATDITESRNGRIWKWEGDGGLAAFHVGDKNVQAALAGMEPLLELFV